ncbi:hypothetical protein EDD11_007265 [Mortierella claussenii]|nr:hypothetical protein EDD11_007265 [Mortierella claussenii]
MAEFLATHFDVEHSMVHIDGLPSVEKQAEHYDRGLKRAKELEKAASGVDKTTALSQAHKWAPRSLVAQIEKHLIRARTLAAIDKQAFQAGLEDRGFRVCMCQTEADLCIARHARAAATEDFFAESSDSDLLVHMHIPKVLRPISRSSEFALYTKADIVQRLSLPSIDHPTLLGIVQKNDYSTNVRFIGMITNFDINSL